jgi:RNA polymerase sigma-70 factor, ECF subfamily
LEPYVPFLVNIQESNSMQRASTSIDDGQDGKSPCGQVAGQAFGHLLSSGLPALYRGAYRLLGNTADAEDAVQDALLAAYTHLDQFRGQSKMSTWLGAIVHNSARMQLRRRLRHVYVALDERIGENEEHSLSLGLADRRPSPEDRYRDFELGRHLAHFQNKLTPKLRRTFQLRDIDGLSIREAARILGVPNGTVKAQSARARKKLMDFMRRALRSRTRTLTDAAPRPTLARV